MLDNISDRLRKANKNADEVAAVHLALEAADHIDNLLNQLRIQAEVINGDTYHTISGGLHLDAALEIERLQEELNNATAKAKAYYELVQAYKWSHAHLSEWPDAIAHLVAENYALKKAAAHGVQ